MNAAPAMRVGANAPRRRPRGEIPPSPKRDAKIDTPAGLGALAITIILGCADSRVSPELAFDQSRGLLFVIRLAGNFVDDNGLASAEYGVAVLGASLIVVLGHS